MNTIQTWKFNGVELTPKSLEAACQFYIRNAKACIAEAQSGKVTVNDLDGYIAFRERHIKSLESDDHPMSLAFLQRAYYEQTGESIALLP